METPSSASPAKKYLPVIIFGIIGLALLAGAAYMWNKERVRKTWTPATATVVSADKSWHRESMSNTSGGRSSYVYHDLTVKYEYAFENAKHTGVHEFSSRDEQAIDRD